MKIQTSIRVEDKFYKEAKVVFKKVGLTFIQKNRDDDDLMKAQELSMSKTWHNDKDKAWDEL